MSLKDAADGAASLLNQIDGLRCYPATAVPDSINELPACVVLPQGIDYNTSFDPDFDAQLRILLFLSRADTPSAYNKLYDFIEPTGDYSIKAQLETDATLGGNCDDSRVISNSGAGFTIWGGVPYISTEFIVGVLINED